MQDNHFILEALEARTLLSADFSAPVNMMCLAESGSEKAVYVQADELGGCTYTLTRNDSVDTIIVTAESLDMGFLNILLTDVPQDASVDAAVDGVDLAPKNFSRPVGPQLQPSEDALETFEFEIPYQQLPVGVHNFVAGIYGSRQPSESVDEVVIEEFRQLNIMVFSESGTPSDLGLDLRQLAGDGCGGDYFGASFGADTVNDLILGTGGEYAGITVVGSYNTGALAAVSGAVDYQLTAADSEDAAATQQPQDASQAADSAPLSDVFCIALPQSVASAALDMSDLAYVNDISGRDFETASDVESSGGDTDIELLSKAASDDLAEIDLLAIAEAKKASSDKAVASKDDSVDRLRLDPVARVLCDIDGDTKSDGSEFLADDALAAQMPQKSRVDSRSDESSQNTRNGKSMDASLTLMSSAARADSDIQLLRASNTQKGTFWAAMMTLAVGGRLWFATRRRQTWPHSCADLLSNRTTDDQ